jgi:hypothetical protein
MKKSYSFPTLCFVIVVISFASCSKLVDILHTGPSFGEYDWKSLNVRYWIISHEEKYIERQFVISDALTMTTLRKAFGTPNSRLKSVAGRKIMLLTIRDGQQWDVNFVFPTYIGFCNSQNNKLSYAITLSDTTFYDTLRQQCLSHEMEFTPNVKIENIKLGTGVISRDPKVPPETVLPLIPE